jgi:hypothetical protein
MHTSRVDKFGCEGILNGGDIGWPASSASGRIQGRGVDQFHSSCIRSFMTGCVLSI